MTFSDPPISPVTGYVSASANERNESDKTQTTSISWLAMMFRIKPRSLRVMIGVTWVLSILVLVRTYSYTHGTIRLSSFGPITTRIEPESTTGSSARNSWIDKIIYYRTLLADVSHQLKTSAHDRKRSSSANDATGWESKSSYTDDNLMVDISILYEAVMDTVHDVGVRGLLFEVLSDDFEYYVYSDESISYDSEDYDDDSFSDSIDEIHAYWQSCASKHGVGNGCNEWDIWWTYHYTGVILTDMLLHDHELLWDGSSGETIRYSMAGSGQHQDENRDDAMALLLDKILRLQAGLPYVTQASFHAEHSLIWRYIERSSGRLSTSYPWELAKSFCRGDGSRPKGIVGRPVQKGVDHECFHGFGHGMFYAVASRQLDYSEPTQPHQLQKLQRHEREGSYIVLRPHGGFELSPESYCEVWKLCRGASPSKKQRRILDPNDEASGNSYRICFEGVVHSVRLFSKDSPQMTDKQTAIDIVEKEMKRCASSERKIKKEKTNRHTYR